MDVNQLKIEKHLRGIPYIRTAVHQILIAHQVYQKHSENYNRNLSIILSNLDKQLFDLTKTKDDGEII